MASSSRKIGLVTGQPREDNVHHRMPVTDQVLPEKFAPSLAQERINPAARVQGALAVNVTDELVTRHDFVAKTGQERSNVSSPVGHDANLHFAAQVAVGCAADDLGLTGVVSAQ